MQSILNDLETADNSIFTAIKLTARLRNTVGHNLGWEDGLTKIQYQKLFMMVASSCIHVMAKLYGLTADEIVIVDEKDKK